MKLINKKIMMGAGTIAAIAAPVASVIACGSTNTKNLWNVSTKSELKIGLGIPTEDKNVQSVKDLLANDAKTISKEFNGRKVSFEMSIHNDDVANQVGKKYAAAILPSAIIAKHLGNLKIAFMPTRPSLKISSKIDDIDASVKMGDQKLKDELSYLNGYLSGSTVYSKPSDVYGKQVDFYRSEIYTINKDAAKYWNNPTAENFKKFIALGIVTHGTTSRSGYITPEKMIATHFKQPNWKISSLKNGERIKGAMKNMDNTHQIYFSYAGELLEKGPAKQKEFIKGIFAGLQGIALSNPIANEGIVVEKNVDETTIDHLKHSMVTILDDNEHNGLKGIYYHKNYEKLREETRKLIESMK